MKPRGRLRGSQLDLSVTDEVSSVPAEGKSLATWARTSSSDRATSDVIAPPPLKAEVELIDHLVGKP